MKKRSFYLIVCLLAITLTQCTPTPKLSFVNKTSEPIDTLVVFPIYSVINTVVEKDKMVKSEFFSVEAENQMKKQLINYIPKTVNTKFVELDTTTEKKVFETYSKLFKTLRISINPKKIAVPSYLLHILDSLGATNGLFVFHEGFTRSEDNYKKEYIKRRNLNMVSLGFYNTVPNSAYSIMVGIMVNKSQKNVLMYKELFWRNRDPNEEVVIRSQIRDIVLSYFLK